MYKRNLKNLSKRNIDIQIRSVRLIPKMFKGIRNICAEYQKPIKINFNSKRNYRVRPGYFFDIFKNIKDESKRPCELITNSTYMNDDRLNVIAYPKYNMKQLVRYYI